MDDFKAFDRFFDRQDCGCKHERVDHDGVCEECFEIQWYPRVNGHGCFQRASYTSVSKHSKSKHFEKILDKRGCNSFEFISKFEDFVWAWERIDKGGRKNFLLNGWVFWKICEVLEIDCEKYVIKNSKSRDEHERLGKLIFEKLEWSKEINVYIK